MANSTETTNRNNLIGNGTFKGDIETEGDIRIDGMVLGTVKTTGRVVIGQQGKIDGIVNCNNADIFGTVKGTLVAEELTSLKATAFFEGDLRTKQLFIEVGAFFSGKCDMGTPTEKETNE